MTVQTKSIQPQATQTSSINLAAYLNNRARATPQALALTDSESTVRFGELADCAARQAGALRARDDINRGDRVVLFMENQSAFIQLLFACWTAGLIAVPANAKLHPRELAHIVRDSGARLVFASERLAESIASEMTGVDCDVIVTGSRTHLEMNKASPIDCVATDAADTAWLFYTSGTTGNPKGAMLSHRCLMFMCMSYFADIERVEPGHTKLHAAPLSHASGLYALPHLFGGGHQVILPGFEPQQILQSLEQYPGVTMFGAPTMVTRLMSAVGSSSDISANLRTLYYGGGPMYVNDLRRALEIFGPRLYQVYGQGESPMTITGLPRRDHANADDLNEADFITRLGSVGFARTAVEVRVVDEAGNDVRAGEIGEVVTRSDCLMSGYWNNHAGTDAAMRDGWLWTGDVGMFDDRGYLTLRDRSKDMIISGGTNIYPREIEEVLLRHPDVLECSVIGREHPDWGEEVIAFVVTRSGNDADTDALDGLCLENIARFKRPRQYQTVSELPKNNYGKVLKTALRKLV